jgi:hypothetical protein
MVMEIFDIPNIDFGALLSYQECFVTIYH